MKPGITVFSKPSPELAECTDLVAAFDQALDISATDLVLAARIAREEAIRYRSIGKFPLAVEVVDMSAAVLDGRIEANDTNVSPLEYSHLNRELVGTLMLQADLAATTGNYPVVRSSVRAARKANYRTESDEREDLTDQTRSILETVIANGSLLARVRARRELKNLPESKKSPENVLKVLDMNILNARREWGIDDVPVYRIAEDWLRYGDEHSVEQARLIALYRLSSNPIYGINVPESWRKTYILLECAWRGNIEAAHDLLHHTKQRALDNPDSVASLTDVIDTLLAGLFVKDEDVIEGALQMVPALRESFGDKVCGIRCLDLAEPQILAGERDPYKIKGMLKKVDGYVSHRPDLFVGKDKGTPHITPPKY